MPSKGRITGTVRAGEQEIEGEWESDANRKGRFFVVKDQTAGQPPLTTNQPTIWESEVKNSTIHAFQMPLADLTEIVTLFANAAKEARERHENWLNQYWHGQPPPAAITAIPNATIEITQGETFTFMSDFANFDLARIGSDLKTFCLYSYKQGAPVVPSHGVQVLLTGINGAGNASGVINVHGLELNWARGVLSTFTLFFGRRRVRRTWLHNPRSQRVVPFIAGIWMLWLLFFLLPVIPDSLRRFPVIAFGVALYLFLIINFSFNALLGLARRAYPLYEIQFPEQAPFQKRRKMVWTIVSAVVLAIVGSVAGDAILSLIRGLLSVVCQNLVHAEVSGKFRRVRMVEFERRFGGLTMTQQDRSYRGADGVTKPGRLLADRPPESAPSATPVTREHDTGDCASVRQPGYDRGALTMSGPTPSTIAVPDTARCDGAARTKEKLLEHREQPVGGRNRQ